MLDNINLENILFIDIETIPQYPSFKAAPELYQHYWEKKSKYITREPETPADVYTKAGIYSEFGRIICISVAYMLMRDNQRFLRLKSFFGEDEKEFLPAFVEMLDSFASKKEIQLCAHNGKEFDFPYIARRLLINNLKLPKVLDIAGKKPWESVFIDTMELWKFGDYKHYTSLDLLTYLFGIPNPKDEMDGSMVADVFYNGKDLQKIVTYCEKDVISIAQLLLKYKGEELIPEKNIEKVS